MPLVAEDRILRTGMAAVVGAVVVSVLLGTLGDPWRTGVAAALTVVLVAVGSPHGAVDHLVLVTTPPPGPHDAARAADAGPAGPVGPVGPVGRAGAGSSVTGGVAGRLLLAGRGSLRGLSGRFVAGYAGLALLSLTAYLLAPRAGFALFLVLSVAHFAAGEAGVAVDRGLARGWGDPLAWAAALGGVVVVVLPLASDGAGSAVAAVDPRLTPVLAAVGPLAPAVGVLTAVALLGCLVAARRGSAGAPVVGVELLALTALAVLADPLLAFAAYFAFWHSLRHQARLAQLLRGPGRGPAPHHVGRPLREVAGSALAGVPATVGVLGVAVVLAVTGTSLLGGLLAVIWALTVPHSCAVVVLEVRAARRRRQGWPGTGSTPVASNDHDTHPAHAVLGGPAPARRHADRVRRRPRHHRS